MEKETQKKDEAGNLHKPLVSGSPISPIFIGIHKKDNRKVFTNFLWGRNGMGGGGWLSVVEEENKAEKKRVVIEKLQFDIDPYDYDWFLKTFNGEIYTINQI